MGFHWRAANAQCSEQWHGQFSEYHNVYVQAQNLDAYMKTGEFPEGTVFIKELTRLVNPTFPDGSRTEPSGRGF